MNIHFNDFLPVIFMALMGLAMLIYVVLDGFDLGVGILLNGVDEDHKDMMIASIGPFWDANETWLVLGVGILLVAFPMAHGVILGALYLPVALMLVGLTLRGVAFDFRVKAKAHHKPWWNFAFFAGSLLTSFSQGGMLGYYITGFADGWLPILFAVFTGMCLVSGYMLLGACWLIIKAEDDLQDYALSWARRALWLTGLGVAALSVVTPFVSQRIFDKWFSFPNILLLAPIPLITVALFVVADCILVHLKRNPLSRPKWHWLPFASIVGIFVMAFHGLAYSLFPYLVVDRITIWQAASAPESLKFMLVGIVIVLPTILGYTIYSYRVFSGKVKALSYY